jgi:hypothetical protein
MSERKSGNPGADSVPAPAGDGEDTPIVDPVDPGETITSEDAGNPADAQTPEGAPEPKPEPTPANEPSPTKGKLLMDSARPPAEAYSKAGGSSSGTNEQDMVELLRDIRNDTREMLLLAREGKKITLG